MAIEITNTMQLLIETQPAMYLSILGTCITVLFIHFVINTAHALRSKAGLTFVIIISLILWVLLYTVAYPKVIC